MHEALPGDDLYLPATHAWQPPPLGPVWPALQAQEANNELPDGEAECAGQTCLSLVAPTQKYPAGQVAPAADDVAAAQNLPGAAVQLEHAEAPYAAYVPALQPCLSLEPPTQKCPDEQVQPAADDEYEEQYLPGAAVQLEHADAPDAANVPALQPCL